MRFVTILILFTLAAAAYVANFAANDRQTSADPTTELVSGAGGQDVAMLDADQSTGDNGPMDSAEMGYGTASGNAGAFPSEFPSELTRRSSGSTQGTASEATQQPSQRRATEQVGAAASSLEAGPKAPTRRRVAPIVRQPNAEENAERDRLVAERFGTGAALEGSSADEASDVQVITLPSRKPARERVVELQEVDSPSAVSDTAMGVRDVVQSKVGEETTESLSAAAAAAAAGANNTLTQGAEVTLPSSAGSEGAAPKGAAPESTAPESPAVAAAGQPARSGAANTTPAETAPQSVIRVRVVDSTGRAVPKVKMALVKTSTGRAVKEVQTGEDGTANAEVSSSGRYRLEVASKSVPLGISSPIGIQECRVDTQPAGYGSVCVNVEAGDRTVPAEVVLPLSSGIQGTILGKTGAPVKGVLVRAISRVPGFEEHRMVAETNDEGFFFFGLVPGPYELQMLLPGKGRPEELTRTMEVFAKPGSALLLDAVDFSKKAPERQSMATQPEAPRPAPAAAKPSRVAMGTPSEATLKRVVQPTYKPAPKPAVNPRAAEASFTVQEKASKVVAVEPKAVVLAKPIEPKTAPARTEPTLRVQAPVRRPAGKPGHVELRGRVISKWGETVPALSVTVESPEGRILEATQTSDNGQYILEDVPVGTVIVRVASDLVVNRKGRYGTTLLKRPTPVRVQTFDGQRRVSLKDVVVDIRRIYRLAGRINVQPEALAEFKRSLGRINEGQPELTEAQLRRAYYRGLRLTQKNRGAKAGSKDPRASLGQAIQIQKDGTFVWSCPLPAEDILLVLEPRSSRKSIGYAGPIGIPVTPAGVRPAALKIMYPPVAKKAPMDGDSIAATRLK